MTIIILGLLLWTLVHVWKRVAPDHRASFGPKGAGIVAVGSVIAIILMVVGYRGATGDVLWDRTSGMTGLNNLLMLFAFYLFATSGAKTRITKSIRHPQLTAVIVWSGAHLLVNGDTPSILLFGGMALWAAMEIILINGIQGARTPYHAVPIKKEITAIVATVVVFVVVALIHMVVGPSPFG
ncbi:MAG: NnrU family protein [Yoonia sp.]|jgi:uncharacterized membrane protein|nr:NnrU family protein [Yoonia sp.]